MPSCPHTLLKLIFAIGFAVMSTGDFAFAVKRTDLTKGECLPLADSGDSEERERLKGMETWPVKAVFLHGWFEKNGSGGYSANEAGYRRAMERWAIKHKIRIAVPIAASTVNTSRGLMRSWDGSSIKSVEDAASEVCGGMRLEEDRVLIGFSAGGYGARKIGLSQCSCLESYAKVVTIGAPTTGETSGCNGKVVNSNPHDLTATTIRWLDEQVGSVVDARTTAAKNPSQSQNRARGDQCDRVNPISSPSTSANPSRNVINEGFSPGSAPVGISPRSAPPAPAPPSAAPVARPNAPSQAPPANPNSATNATSAAAAGALAPTGPSTPMQTGSSPGNTSGNAPGNAAAATNSKGQAYLSAKKKAKQTGSVEPTRTTPARTVGQ